METKAELKEGANDNVALYFAECVNMPQVCKHVQLATQKLSVLCAQPVCAAQEAKKTCFHRFQSKIPFKKTYWPAFCRCNNIKYCNQSKDSCNA